MYENQGEWRRQRDKKMSLANGICEDCGDKAKIVHHKDKTKNNHSLENLRALCYRCHKIYHPANGRLINIPDAIQLRKKQVDARNKIKVTLDEEGCMNVNYKNYREKLGKAVGNMREEKQLSMEALAARIEGVSIQTLARIEKGDYSKDISLHIIQVVCNELDFPVNMNFGGAS